MVEINIPNDLRDEFYRIVDEIYDGDEQRACREAIRQFVEQGLKHLSSGSKFEHALTKRQTIEKDRTGYSDKGFDDALSKIKERRERISKKLL